MCRNIRDKGRLPAWTRPQVPKMMDVVVRMPSGVRLIFDTNASEVSISALATNLVTLPAEKRPAGAQKKL
jgi:hypothetical protein